MTSSSRISKSTLRLLPIFLALSALLPAETLTIATYNVNNYLNTSRRVQGAYRKDAPKPEPEKAALRANIKTINPDIIALQEMGDRAHLDELLAALKRDGMDYPYSDLLESPGDTDRHLAIISRRPLTTVRKHTDLSFKYLDTTATVKRGLLEAHVDTEAGDLALFIVHLKSRLTEPDHRDDPESAIRRAAEATAIRDRILKTYPAPAAPASLYLILGDCNDTRDSRPLRALSARGKTQIATPLPGGDTRGEVWTHYYAKQDTYTRFDHILVSPALKPGVQDKTVAIYDGPGALTASDHRPVIVRLTLKKTGNP